MPDLPGSFLLIPFSDPRSWDAPPPMPLSLLALVLPYSVLLRRSSAGYYYGCWPVCSRLAWCRWRSHGHPRANGPNGVVGSASDMYHSSLHARTHARTGNEEKKKIKNDPLPGTVCT
ncbi:hypothetical protein GQ53DRAFT_16560 [Thozetella sp. PMI_491]|nr:hypothetical protein GQ53DRAFT_16560 [Thozetella sp. PMI_491]